VDIAGLVNALELGEQSLSEVCHGGLVQREVLQENVEGHLVPGHDYEVHGAILVLKLTALDD